jgi:hypothetical protein
MNTKDKSQKEVVVVNDRILASLRVAKTKLERAMEISIDEDFGSFDNDVWRSAEELEYALFLFSLIIQNGDYVASKKVHRESSEGMAGSLLVEAMQLLSRAERFMGKSMLLDAYADIYVARGCLLSVQDYVAKKKQEALKKR